MRRSRPASTGPRGRLRNAPAGQIGERAGKISNKYKVAKHFTLTIADGVFAYERKTEQINSEASLDGLYAIRTTLPAQTLGAAAAVRAYKQLKMAERAFGTMKDTIEIRPIHHHLETRVRAHVFLCMLAYYVSFELQARLPELLFTDQTPLAPADPVKPATRSRSAHAKAGSATTPTGYPAHTLTDLLADLATICRNTVRIGPRRAHLHPPHHTHPATSPHPRTTRHQTPPVAKAKPTRKYPNPAPPRGIQRFNPENFRLAGAQADTRQTTDPKIRSLTGA